jgi:hypothetical protein
MPSPDVRHCLICEDIRIEHRNLVSFMGVYGATPFVGIRLLNFQAPVAFSLVFMGAPAQGRFVIELELRDPSGVPIKAAEVVPERNDVTFSPEWGSIVFGFRVRVAFPGPNTYTIALRTNGVEFFKDTLQLVQGTAADSN